MNGTGPKTNTNNAKFAQALKKKNVSKCLENIAERASNSNILAK
jgi:hypothetical protein